jgi:ADP-heptose:LPS heptosyltransferase
MLLWNLSLTMLQLGDYANGWSLYEFRWPTDHQPTKVRPGARLTHTHALAGKSILVYGEQGLGDMIQFCRYLDLLAQQGAQLIVQAPLTLHRLLAQLPGVVQVIAMEAQAPACDYHCPMMSLPLIFQTQLNTIPSHHHPYLSATTDKQHEWRQRLGVSTKRRIGLVVRGQTRNPREHLRSIGLQTLLPFLPSAHEYFLLHQQLHHDDALALSTAPHIHHLSDHIHSMDDTAALCQLMDLVISVDTSVAHLSAALARPTWILLALASDWRWLLQRSDSPWYDSVRLFRQTQQHDWSSVLHEFSTQLAQLDS